MARSSRNLYQGLNIFSQYYTNGSRVTDVLLGLEIAEFTRILGDKSKQFKTCCIVNLHKMWCKYNNIVAPLFCLFLLLYNPSQQLWSWRDG